MNEEANINFYNVFVKFYKFCVTVHYIKDKYQIIDIKNCYVIEHK